MLIAAATVLGWNALALAALWITAASGVEQSRATDPEGFAAMALAIIAIIGTFAIVVSTAIGVTVTLVRGSSRPDWLPPTLSTGRAILAGTRTAAWGLLILVPVTLMFVHP